MSKLGNLASRAPNAMFSRSRKTAMVASDVVVAIGSEVYSIPRWVAAPPRLEPVVIEADADAFGVNAIRHHLVPQPTFKQHQAARGGGKCSPGAGLARGGRFARRRCHEA